MKPLLLAAVALGFVTPARVDPDSEYFRQLRREGHSEFCANVGKPSQRLAQAIDQTMAQDPSWANEAAWLNRIAEAYAKAGCGDA